MIDYTFSLEELEYFLLILVRVTCFIYVAPFFGMNNVPRRVKIGLGFFISMVLYHIPSVPHVRLSYQTVWGYGVIVMKEALTGLLIGFGAQLCTSIVNFAGRLMDMNIGLSMVNMMDPTTRENTSISGVFLQYITMLILLITGLYQFLRQPDTVAGSVHGGIYHDRLPDRAAGVCGDLYIKCRAGDPRQDGAADEYVFRRDSVETACRVDGDVFYGVHASGSNRVCF